MRDRAAFQKTMTGACQNIRRAGLWLGIAGVPFLVAACTPRTPNPYSGRFGHMMWYGYGGMFMWLLFLILAGMLIYFVVSQARKAPGPDGPPETPQDILKKRYARGEIDREEFERLKKDLES